MKRSSEAWKKRIYDRLYPPDNCCLCGQGAPVYPVTGPYSQDIPMLDGSVDTVHYVICHTCIDMVPRRSESIVHYVERQHYSWFKPTSTAIKKLISTKFGIKWKDITVSYGHPSCSWLEVTVPPWHMDQVEDYIKANVHQWGIGSYLDDMNQSQLEVHVGWHHRIVEELFRQADEAEEDVRELLAG
jgi:hypothetical protein